MVYGAKSVMNDLPDRQSIEDALDQKDPQPELMTRSENQVAIACSAIKPRRNGYAKKFPKRDQSCGETILGSFTMTIRLLTQLCRFSSFVPKIR